MNIYNVRLLTKEEFDEYLDSVNYPDKRWCLYQNYGKIYAFSGNGRPCNTDADNDLHSIVYNNLALRFAVLLETDSAAQEPVKMGPEYAEKMILFPKDRIAVYIDTEYYVGYYSHAKIMCNDNQEMLEDSYLTHAAEKLKKLSINK